MYEKGCLTIHSNSPFLCVSQLRFCRMVARVSVNDCNSTVHNTRFQSTRFVMYIQSHTWFPSAFNRHLLVWLTWPLCPIGKELAGPAFIPWLDEVWTCRLEPGQSLARHLSTAPGPALAVPCVCQTRKGIGVTLAYKLLSYRSDSRVQGDCDRRPVPVCEDWYEVSPKYRRS